MLYYKRINFFIFVIGVIGFNACGGSNSTKENSDRNLFEKIDLNVDCTNPDIVESYISLNSGDQIVKEKEGTKISIFHNENDVKKVCLDRGKAYINRMILK